MQTGVRGEILSNPTKHLQCAAAEPMSFNRASNAFLDHCE